VLGQVLGGPRASRCYRRAEITTDFAIKDQVFQAKPRVPASWRTGLSISATALGFPGRA
jgi:hypothetical protein